MQFKDAAIARRTCVEGNLRLAQDLAFFNLILCFASDDEDGAR